MSKVLQVQTTSDNYPIYIGQSLLEDKDVWQPHLKGQQVLVVSQEAISQHYYQTLRTSLAGYDVTLHQIPQGEDNKDLSNWSSILDSLLAKNYHRDCTLIALGGGIVGDMTGFAAACYQRGVNFIQCPTTLLAQVDSSVGGKTGVNHPHGKNMIGAFYQPQSVVIDINTLKTLPAREFNAGIAEVIKYGLIQDADFFAYLIAQEDAIKNEDPETLIEIITRSCALKADIVNQDEKEQGIRAILNFGHTFGHAIEKATAHQLLHGEAVALGMLMATKLSQELNGLASDVYTKLLALVEKFALPKQLPKGTDSQALFDYMQRDKKVLNGELRLILLQSLGKAEIKAGVPADLIQKTIADFC